MKQILKQYFGYDTFRPGQEEIINHILQGRDSFVLMPTGGGKSLCYQLPALQMDGLTLVISPLIALMKDQVDALQAYGISAEFINSSLNHQQINEIRRRTKNNEIKILYCAPERLGINDFQQWLQSLNINLIAVDEAHCISEWGHDFRPDYANLSRLKEFFPNTPIIALTATATPKVQADILKQLKLTNPFLFQASFNRPNLKIKVEQKRQAFPKLVKLIKKYPNESVIIYCFSRKETEEISEKLNLNGLSAISYHAGLSNKDRKNAQDLFIKDKKDIIVATIAFGMGIDKPDVRLVVHYTYPKTLEGYYQEIGRAGRDGLPSDCVLFYTYADTYKHNFFIDQITDQTEKEKAQTKLRQVIEYADNFHCRKKYLLEYFGEKVTKDNCGQCDVCLQDKAVFDATIISQKILSAIIKLHNRFGRTYVINVLRGSREQKVLNNNHDQLSVYGIVKDFSANDLTLIIKYLIQKWLIQKTVDQYPVLQVSPQGRNWLDKRETIKLPEIKSETPLTNNSKSNSKKEKLDYNLELFNILRKIRKQLAEIRNVPPFVIFGDVSLQEMAYYFPIDNQQFLQINGVGEQKLIKFGEVFITAIKKFITENNLQPKTNNPAFVFSSQPKIINYNPTHYQVTKSLIAQKLTIKEIAEQQGVKKETIFTHLEKMIAGKEDLDLEYLKTGIKDFNIISNAFQEVGDDFLKPVFEYLQEKYNYDDLKITRLLRKNAQAKK